LSEYRPKVESYWPMIYTMSTGTANQTMAGEGGNFTSVKFDLNPNSNETVASSPIQFRVRRCKASVQITANASANVSSFTLREDGSNVSPSIIISFAGGVTGILNVDVNGLTMADQSEIDWLFTHTDDAGAITMRGGSILFEGDPP